MNGKLPDFAVFAHNQATDLKAQVGAAWTQEDGTVQLLLNPYVNLQQGGEIIMILVPRESKRIVTPATN